MADPLEALRKAQTIGSGVPNVTLAEMPLAPFSGAALRGLTSAVGEVNPEFTAVGSEPIYNAGKGLYEGANRLFGDVGSKIYEFSKPVANKMEQMYQEANPVFKRLQQAGLFGGSRTIDNLR